MPEKRIIVTMTMAAALLLAGGAAAYIWSGGYNVAADDEHTRLVAGTLTTVRERSVERQARSVVVPNLSGVDKVAAGAREYAEMCVVCHRAPGGAASDLARGLNPQPPNLTQHGVHDAAEAFWVIKHGIKMTGMPAWGKTHDDATLWNIVAFLQQLPQMSPEQYQELVGQQGDASSHHGHGASMSPSTGKRKGEVEKQHGDDQSTPAPPHSGRGQ